MDKPKPPTHMTVRVLRDHLTMLIDTYDVGELAILSEPHGYPLVNSAIDSMGNPYVQTAASYMKRFA